jgi:ELWxxDGT repeat protein
MTTTNCSKHCGVLVGVFAIIIGPQLLQAQFSDAQTFDGTAGTQFAVPPQTVPYWSVDDGFSGGIIFKDGTRGDNGTSCLKTLTPVDTGTRLIRDLNPGPGSSNITDLEIAGLDVIWRLFISADDTTGTTGHELYRVGGTLYPAVTLTDINAGAGASAPSGFYRHSALGLGVIYFSADNETAGRELYKVTTANSLVNNTTLIKDINPAGSSAPAGFAVSVGSATLVLFSADDGTNGRELWKSDGTAANTVLLADINTATGASSDPQSLTSLSFAGNDIKVFFTADDGVNGRELWRSDGTTTGTVLVKDIVSGAAGSNPGNLTAGNGLVGGTPAPLLYFTVDSDGVNGQELWISRGSVDGSDTVSIYDPGIAGSPTSLTAVSDLYLVFFVVGNELWKSDGTSANTALVKSFAAPPTNLVSAGSGTTSLLYFAADDGTGNGVELWKADATTATLAKDINPGANGSSPQDLSASGSTVYFSADDGTNGRELWRTDTVAGAILIKDINPGSADSNPAQFTNWDGNVAFTADDGTHGRELWQTDGYPTPRRAGLSYKWDLASLIQAKTGDASKVAAAATDSQPLSAYWVFDFPAMGGNSGVSAAAHQINTYVELTDGTDRAPLAITQVDCGDNGISRPKAALTDGTVHKAIAFGLVAVLDQNPCDTNSRGPANPGVPFAYVPAVYDGHDWIPVDLSHIPAGVPTDPPTAPSLAQGTWAALAADATLPSGLVAATTDPWSTKRFTQARIDVFSDYVRVIWASKQTGVLYVATVPRQYKGGFKALHVGNSAGIETPYPFYLDTVRLTGGFFTSSTEPFGACCAPSGCSEKASAAECADGTFTPWTTCSTSGYLCCPIPWADANRDGDTDAEDFAILQTCLTGEAGTVTDACQCFDHNSDTLIDATDIQSFIDCATGPAIPAASADCGS